VAAVDTTTLLLPNGRRTEIAGDPNDRSVFAPLRESGGNWEPHVRQLLEQLVQPDWVCLDIGANIGVHTLALATLARSGKVFAFEAGPTNFRYLERNTEQSVPTTCIQTVLWGRPCTLHFDEIDEFAGCSHITMREPADEGKADLPSASHPYLPNNVTVHIHRRTVPAIPLDDWVRDQQLDRLNLIKLDVEGAEEQVLAGASRTLASFQPLLLTEYNPLTASKIFGLAPDAYFHALRRLYDPIQVIEPDGTLSEPLPDWNALNGRLAESKGWQDLLCTPRPPSRLQRLLHRH
jgi:FkbM family methyltransferase